jgi:hypothetical protein
MSVFQHRGGDGGWWAGKRPAMIGASSVHSRARSNIRESSWRIHTKRLIPADQLKIDAIMTREHKIWVGEALVPLVYLKNGEILIPATKYQEGARALNQQSR